MEKKSLITFIIIFVIVSCWMQLILAQEISECGTKRPEENQMADYITDLPIIDQVIQLRSGGLIEIPLNITVLRNSDGSEDIPHSKVRSVDQPLIDEAIYKINQVFSPSGLVFRQLWSINYIDHTDLRKLKVPYWQYAYVSSALNIVIGGLETGGVRGSANMPHNLPAAINHSNTLWIRSGDELLSATFIHELGHSFGLFHTFEGAGLYDNPKAPMKNVPDGIKRFADHPGRTAPNYFKRELVIREDQEPGTKLFYQYNADVAGDFVEDTPASCATIPKSNFPDWRQPDCQSWKTMGDCNNGCLYDPDVCVYIGTYVDYNNDTIQNADVMVRNYMSYTGSCRKEFTTGQYERMAFYASTYRKQQYDRKDDQYATGYVTFMDTDAPIDNVNIRLTNPADGRHCNVTTNADGHFQAIIYDDQFEVDGVHKLGQEAVATYYAEDWKSGIDQSDIQLIINHLNGVEKLNSFQQLAADVNGDGQVTVMDANLIERLLSGSIPAFTGYDSPWQFFPKQIIEDQGRKFLVNPFCVKSVEKMLKSETNSLSNRYRLLFSNNDIIFVGLKLGDIDGSQAKILPSSPQTKINAKPVSHFTPDNFVTPFKQNSMDFATSNQSNEGFLHCFPNPTYSGLNVAFNSGEESRGKISIIGASGKVISIIEKFFTKGSNHITIAENQLPKGVVQINVTTEKGSFTKKIIKME